MSNTPLFRVFAVIAGATLLFAVFSLRSSSLNEVTYRLQLNQELVESTDTSILLTSGSGLEIRLHTAQFNLASFELYPCEHAEPVSVAYAGHDSEAYNPAKVSGVGVFDLRSFEPRSFAAQLDMSEYCTFHQAIGPNNATGTPAVTLIGTIWDTKKSNSRQINIVSNSAYGATQEVQFVSGANTLATFTYQLEALFTEVTFDMTEAEIARSVQESLIHSVRLAVD